MKSGRLPRSPRAVLFDMDGTLLDSERLSQNAFGLAAEELGVVFETGFARQLTGLRADACKRLLRQHLPGDKEVESLFTGLQVHYQKLIADGELQLKPGALEILQFFAESAIPCAVVTSTHRLQAVHKLGLVGILEYFATVVGGDCVARGKPAPDPFLLAAQQLGVAPGDCLVVEDSPIGIQSALAAGMPTVWIPDTIAPSGELAARVDLVLDSFEELLKSVDGSPHRIFTKPSKPAPSSFPLPQVPSHWLPLN